MLSTHSSFLGSITSADTEEPEKTSGKPEGMVDPSAVVDVLNDVRTREEQLEKGV